MSTEAEPNMEFMRLLFTSPVEEEIALRWSKRLGRLLGMQALALRPETTLYDLMNWAEVLKADSFSFVCVFEPELREQFASFLDTAESVSFRQMVQHAASWYPSQLSKPRLQP
jgi:hypothetical protein